MKGLRILVTQGSPYQWSMVGWCEQIGDDVHVYNCGIFQTLGDKDSSLSSVAATGPTKETRLYPLCRERYHTLHKLREIETDPGLWVELCPKPEGWEE